MPRPASRQQAGEKATRARNKLSNKQTSSEGTSRGQAKRQNKGKQKRNKKWSNGGRQKRKAETRQTRQNTKKHQKIIKILPKQCVHLRIVVGNVFGWTPPDPFGVPSAPVGSRPKLPKRNKNLRFCLTQGPENIINGLWRCVPLKAAQTPQKTPFFYAKS